MNRVLDHVRSDLARPLPLSELAEVADLSPFHFHRIFQAMVGETPNEFVKRLRLEKSLYLMCFGKQKSFTEIALACGFTSSSDFTRCFKLHHGVAPSKFDLEAWQSKNVKQFEVETRHSTFRFTSPRTRDNPDQFRVRIRNLPARWVAYIRVSNPYQGDGVVQAAHRLMSWINNRKLSAKQWLGYQFENPKVTALERCQYCVAVETHETVKPDGEVGVYRFPAMQIAEVAMKGDIEMEIRLFQWLYGSWLPRSKYVPADQPSFEAWFGRPFEHGLEYFELFVQLPIT